MPGQPSPHQLWKRTANSEVIQPTTSNSSNKILMKIHERLLEMIRIQTIHVPLDVNIVSRFKMQFEFHAVYAMLMKMTMKINVKAGRMSTPTSQQSYICYAGSYGEKRPWKKVKN